jgi:FkbM family methyltransferase
MHRKIQKLFLVIYRLVLGTGILTTPVGRSVFESIYLLYKARFEAGPIGQLRRFVRPGSYVIDVGANIGFFTTAFAKWVSGDGRVIAIEPESRNFGRMKKRIDQAGQTGKVEMVQGVAAEVDGILALKMNPHHPGDHRIGEQGEETRAWRLDSLLEERGCPPVSLVKIDVQGAEERVLDGAARLLERERPALFVEVHGVALREFGSSASALLSRLSEEGYALHLLKEDGITDAMDVGEALATLGDEDQYRDFLCLPSDGRTPSSSQSEAPVAIRQ